MPSSVDLGPSAVRAPRHARRWAGLAVGLTVLLTGACTSGPSGDSTSSSRGSSSWSDLQPPDASELSSTLMGWSAAAVPGVHQAIIGTWMERKSWENLDKAQWLADNPDYVDYVEAHPDGAADIGVPLVPHDSGDDLDGLLTEAASGDRDKVYRHLGEGLATSGPATVYARLWWEMNLRPMADGIDPALFQKAWQHAVPLIREGFAAKARAGQQLEIVFSPNADGADYQQFYPGDGAVDLMALDAYGQRWGGDTPSSDQLLDLIDGQLTAFTSFAGSHDKPVAMAEWGNVAKKGSGHGDQMQGRGDFAPYIALVLDWAAREHAQYLVYYDSADVGVAQTLADTPHSLAMLKKAWSAGSS